MQALIDFFLSLGSIITSLVDFVISLIKDIIYVTQLVVKFVAKIPMLFTWLPGSVVAIVVSIFAVVVIYKVLGREG